ncbi:hypothetical protein [Fusobacterium hwasookii]|uniref:hypothetical protein n=1 Tax=Fusobacterium hwasookii TaxID=1583098 RepID=UPI001C6E957F|nr:hypothetical protein [Fusobacterium hwasookii]QYR55558.1 hypothetical protein JY400_02960 [Fusobacterium hwasookii]
MEEYGLELLNERKGDVFSIVNEIFEFGSFLKGDEQENGNKEDKQENLKECIKKYNKVKKSEEKKKKILQYFCDALNKIVPDNKRYKIEEMEKIFSKIEIIYSLNIFQYHDHLKFMIALPLFDSYISKIDNFSDKWEDIISPLDLEIKSSSVKINGSSKSFFRNNQKKLDEILLLTDLKTIENWKKEKNLISTDSIYKNMCEYKKIYEVLSPEIKDLFSILYLKRIIWGIYHNNKESVKEFIRISFETIYLSSSNKISDEEKEKLFIKFLIDESQNVKEEEKESLLNNYINISKLIKNLEKIIENSKIDFEKIFTNSIKRTKLNNENIYIFNEEYNILKSNYNLDKHKKFIKDIESTIDLKNYYEYNYYLYLSIDSYNLLNIEKEKYKNQELRDSIRFLEQLEKGWKGKLNNKIIEEEYKKNFKGEIRTIAEIFNIILEISPNLNMIIEIIFKRIFSNEKLINKSLEYLQKNFNINFIE